MCNFLNSLWPKKQLILARDLTWATRQFTKYFELQLIFFFSDIFLIRAINKCHRLLLLRLSIPWNLVSNPIIIIVFLCAQGQSLSSVNPFSWQIDLFKSAFVTNLNRRRLIVSYNERSWITNCRGKYFFCISQFFSAGHGFHEGNSSGAFENFVRLGTSQVKTANVR